MRPSGLHWKNRMVSVGVSVAANAAILGIMAGVLASPPRHVEALMAVELAAPPSPTSPTGLQTAEPESTEHRAVPQRVAQGQPRLSSPSGLVLPELFRPAEHRTDAPKADHVQARPDLAPTTSDGGTRAATLQALGMGGDPNGSHGEGTESGGGTAGRGPGAPSASGTGAGGSTLVGGDGGSNSVVSVAGHKQEMRRNDPPPVRPDPAVPKGESRAAQVSKQPRPAYPSDARDEGVEGVVVLLAIVGTDGSVSEVRVEKSSGDRRLDKAAETGVRQWKYAPALKDGAPAKTTVRVHVKFELE